MQRNKQIAARTLGPSQLKVFQDSLTYLELKRESLSSSPFGSPHQQALVIPINIIQQQT
jgi:hypothetical protein